MRKGGRERERGRGWGGMRAPSLSFLPPLSCLCLSDASSSIPPVMSCHVTSLTLRTADRILELGRDPSSYGSIQDCIQKQRERGDPSIATQQDQVKKGEGGKEGRGTILPPPPTPLS